MDFDAELQTHKAALFGACTIRSHDHVLDIGCGAGDTTREAARLAARGSALGVDITEPMIARARALAAAEDLHNVSFEHGDAQVHAFPPQHFDCAISRYGTMFFADPIAAFRNIRTALRPCGRLVMMVWQAHEMNEWSVAVHQALAPYQFVKAGRARPLLPRPARVCLRPRCGRLDSVGRRVFRAGQHWYDF